MDAVPRLNGCYVIIFTNDKTEPAAVTTWDKPQQWRQHKNAYMYGLFRVRKILELVHCFFTDNQPDPTAASVQGNLLDL